VNILKNLAKNNVNTARLIVVVLLAFGGTYFNMPTRGLISTLPILLIAVLLSVLIRIPAWQKVLLFGFFAFCLAAIDYDILIGLYFAILCILIVSLCTLAFSLFKKKKILPMILAILIIIVCAIPQALLFGNYSQGYSADKIIDEYVSAHYTNENMVVSGTYYDYKTGLYQASIYDKSLPIDICYLVVNNNRIFDGFDSFVERSLMNNRSLELTAILREKFEKDKFDVYSIHIAGYPLFEKNKEISLNDTTNYNSLMSFRIIVPGLIDKAAYGKKAETYYNAILAAGFDFKEIIFVASGTDRDIMTIKVSTNPLIKDLSKLIAPPVNFEFDKDFYNSLKLYFK